MKTNNQQSLNRWIKPGSSRPRAGKLSAIARTFVFALVVGAILIVAGSALAEGRKGPPPTEGTVQVYLGLKRQTEALERFVAQVSDPANEEMYGKYLSVRQVARKLGVRKITKKKTRAFLRHIGVKGNSVKLDPIGSTYVAEMPEDTAIDTFCYDSTDGSTCIPDDLKRWVTEVMVVTPQYQTSDGLQEQGSLADEGTLPLPTSDRGNNGTPQGCAEGVDKGAYTPNQYRTAYGVDPLWEKGLTGKGVRVALINSYHWEEEDIATFTSCFDLGVPNVRRVSLWSDRTSVNYLSEPYLDTEMVLAIAPEAEITSLTIGTNIGGYFIQGLAALLDARHFGGALPHVASDSGGKNEVHLTTDMQGLAETYLMAAAAVGISYMSASGDQGFLDLNYPPSSPYATGVGGTSMDLYEDNSIFEQTVWHDDAGSGSGSGPSELFDIPDWQHGQGIDEHSPTQRLTPDIALFADGDRPGISFYGRQIIKRTPHWIDEGGGTSAASPMLAGMVALWVQQRLESGKTSLGLLNPLLNHMANSDQYDKLFYDVDEGTSNRDPSKTEWDEGGAGPGYDMATGWGSPQADAIAEYIEELP
jgi:subtilase family serine protease